MMSERAWDEEYDVVVAGSGGGALTGAYTAAREGLSVLVVESTEYFGGTTAYSGGGLWLPGNAALRRAGDDDRPQDARAYYRAVVGERTPRALQDAYLDNGPRLIDYLESDDAFEFRKYPWPDYYGSAPKARGDGRHIMAPSMPAARLGSLRERLRPPLPSDRGEVPLPDELIGGQSLLGRLLLALSRRDGVTMRTAARCEGLLGDGVAVQGALVSTGQGRRRIGARRGVLIASGGFERNQGLRDRYGVPGAARDSMAPQGNQGAAIQAAIEFGADTDLMSEAWWSPGITHPDGRSTFSLWFTGGIFVDVHGERFVNESLPYDRIGRVVLDRLRDGDIRLPFWMVYDDRSGARPPVQSTSVPLGESSDYERAGLWHSAATLGGLADRIGVPGDRLAATVRGFNRMAESGVDTDFRRGEEPYDRFFTGDRSPLVPIEQPPFHAVAFGLSDLGTKGGLCTDPDARVLDVSGAPIQGLYAAGNSMAAVSGTAYPGGGNPIGSSMVFSHLAALHMAQRR
ncbi:FAD-binding protein [Sciscionella marina]|uniref:FAD-binding protein n=1 Tax=Sciscionella marina TaxID=508770 RepID=UPI001969D844|nr:FAD-binding protein [Sciscionella marina]